MWQVVLALRYARRNPLQTGLLSVCIAVTLAIPVTSRLLVDRFEQRMSSQADEVPLVIGPRGSRFDLALASVFFRQPPERTITMGDLDRVGSVEGAEAVPMSTLFTARGRRLVCVGFGYFDRLGLAPAEGTLPLLVGDAVLGSGAARELGLTVGDPIASDRHELFDLSVPPPITMTVVGVLEPTGTSADDAAFASIETAWLIGGQSHIHAEGDELEADDIIAASDRAVAVRPTLETASTITPENALTLHGHDAPELLPITSVLVFADDAKPLTLAAARFEGDPTVQAIRPRLIVEEMMQTVVRVQAVFDAIIGLLAAGTVVLVLLTTSLAARLRSQEFTILDSVGASRFFRPTLLLLQLVLVSVVALVLAGAIVAVALGVLSSVTLV
ncbi:MAG: ABC transporter permease [Planctomycetota bacterium]